MVTAATVALGVAGAFFNIADTFLAVRSFAVAVDAAFFTHGAFAAHRPAAIDISFVIIFDLILASSDAVFAKEATICTITRGAAKRADFFVENEF